MISNQNNSAKHKFGLGYGPCSRLNRGLCPASLKPSLASLEENAVDNAVFSRAGCDSDVAFVGFNNRTFDQDVSANVVGVGSILDHVVDVAENGFSGFWIVNADLVSSHHTDHGVATGLAVDLALGFSNEGELLLSGDFSCSLTARLYLSST